MIPQLYESCTIPDYDTKTAMSKAKCEILYRVLTKHGAKKTLEIGLGYGCSAAYIIAATGSEHWAIDPYQKTKRFESLGLQNLKSLGFIKQVVFEETPSQEVLPRLLREGTRFDFICIDGDHKFDSAFIDFYYADLLLNDGGIIALDDVATMPSLTMLASWIRTNKQEYTEIKTQESDILILKKERSVVRPWHHFNLFGKK